MQITQEQRELLNSIDDCRELMLSRTKEVCSINSGSYNRSGLMETCDWFHSLFSPIIPSVSQVDLAPIREVDTRGNSTSYITSPCLVFEHNPKADFQIICTGHYDTVFPAHSSFKNVWEDGDKLRGPGVADMKGGLVVLWQTLKVFLSSRWSDQCGITVILSPDEEIGSPSSAAILAKYAQRANVGLTYEPAYEDGTFAGARKGSGNFQVVLRGVAAHAGRAFFEGKNALIAASKLAVMLSELSDEDTGVTINVGCIDGGGPVNVVPETAVVRFNVRVFEESQMAPIIQSIDNCMAQVNSETGCEVERFGSFNRPPKPMDKRQQPLFELLKDVGQALGQQVHWVPTGGCCEGNNLAAAGLPVVDTLGVRGANIHSDQEYAIIESFVERAKLSTMLLWTLCERKGVLC